MPDSKPPEVVVITGASAGVESAAVREFARHGAQIGLIARGRDGIEAARREVEAAGGKALVLPTDAANPDQVEAAATAVENEFGPIDVWVNDAMTTVFPPFLEITPEEYKRATEVTYLAYRSIPLQAPYCGAKAAIRGFTDTIRTELKHAGSKVHITIIQMPALNTPQFDWCATHLPRHPQPVPPIFEPEVAARAVYWAAHHNRREMDPHRPVNLFEPVPGDHGTRGIFTNRARSRSIQLLANTHRGWLALAGLGLVGTAAAFWESRR